MHWRIDLSTVLLLRISKPWSRVARPLFSIFLWGGRKIFATPKKNGKKQSGHMRLSKRHLVQAGLSMRVTNHTCAWTHTCKNGGYCYFTYLYPVVINNSIPLLEYLHKYPALKLSSISQSSALTLVHIIKNNFNSAYCPCSIVTGTSD